MRIEQTNAAFNASLAQMSNAQSKIQSGFAAMLNKDENNLPTQNDSTQFVSAFVEEDFAARLAEANLKVMKSQDDVLETVLDIKS